MKWGFIGAGEMGGAIIRGILKTGCSSQQLIASVRTPESAHRLSGTLGITVCNDNGRVLKEADFIFLAVKPAQMPQVLAEVAATHVAAKPLISMVLGWSVSKIQQVLPNWPIIRIMPNTPLALCEGVTLFDFAPAVAQSTRQEVRALFDKLGQTWQIAPQQFEAATALSGSGPAFVYYFIEALAQAGQILGLQEQEARSLAIQTVLGATKMARTETLAPVQLAQKVATPGGCTAAGMEVLVSSDLKEILRETLAVTAARAKEVSNQ